MPANDQQVRIKVEGLKELRATLRGIDRRLSTELTRELKRVAGPILAEAQRLAPRSGSARSGAQFVAGNTRGRRTYYRRERNQHVADTLKIGLRRNGVSIYSTRSGAGVIHWGGRHPLFGDRDHWYTQKADPFVLTAMERYGPQVEREIGDMVERLWDGATGTR